MRQVCFQHTTFLKIPRDFCKVFSKGFDEPCKYHAKLDPYFVFVRQTKSNLYNSRTSYNFFFPNHQKNHNFKNCV